MEQSTTSAHSPDASANLAPWANEPLHRRWLWPLAWFAGSIAFYAVFVLSAPDPNGIDREAAIWVVMTVLILLLAQFVSLIFLGVGCCRALAAARRRRGWFNRSEMARLAALEQERRGFHSAQLLARSLAAGAVPPGVQQWELQLHDGEEVWFVTTASYARFYGLNVEYAHTSAVYWGRPAFVVGGMIGDAIGNASRRRAAEAASQDMWRERQSVRIVTTNQRFVCQVGGRWLSFPHAAATAAYPTPEYLALVLHFQDTAPLLLSGPEAATFSAYFVYAQQGAEGVRRHPALTSLLDGEPIAWRAAELERRRGQMSARAERQAR